jgi:hypothetical protein
MEGERQKGNKRLRLIKVLQYFKYFHLKVFMFMHNVSRCLPHLVIDVLVSVGFSFQNPLKYHSRF